MRFSRTQLITILGAMALAVVVLLLPTKGDEEVESVEVSVEETSLVDSAIALVNGEDPMAGIMLLRQILTDDPQNIEALLAMGRFSVQSGQMEKAVERFEQVLELEPNNEEAIYLAGRTQMELGNREDAKKYFEQFLTLSKDERANDEVNKLIQEL